MDKQTLDRLVDGGAVVKSKGRRESDVEILGKALVAQGDKIREVVEKLSNMPAPEAPVVNVDVKPQGAKVNSAPVTVMAPSRPMLKSIKFQVTGRDREGNLKEFEAVPEYEITH